jgi:hypothetical protein
MLKSLGFVWIPGVMAGMLVSGASPIYAGIFQFIIVAMILAASGISGLVATLMMRARAFSGAEQLTLRPGIGAAAPASHRVRPFSIVNRIVRRATSKVIRDARNLQHVDPLESDDASVNTVRRTRI